MAWAAESFVKLGTVSQRLSIDTASVVPLLPFLDAALGWPRIGARHTRSVAVIQPSSNGVKPSISRQLRMCACTPGKHEHRPAAKIVGLSARQHGASVILAGSSDAGKFRSAGAGLLRRHPHGEFRCTAAA